MFKKRKYEADLYEKLRISISCYFKKNFINVFLSFVDRYMHYNIRKDAFIGNEVQ